MSSKTRGSSREEPPTAVGSRTQGRGAPLAFVGASVRSEQSDRRHDPNQDECQPKQQSNPGVQSGSRCVHGVAQRGVSHPSGERVTGSDPPTEEVEGNTKTDYHHQPLARVQIPKAHLPKSDRVTVLALGPSPAGVAQ